MRYWEEIDEAGEVLRTIVMNKESTLDDFRWIQKNLGGTWKLSKKEISNDPQDGE